MKADIVNALIRAHYGRDEEWFRRLVAQAAASCKDEKRKSEMLAQSQRAQLAPLPVDTRQMVAELPKVALSDLVLADNVVGEVQEIGREIRHRSVFLGTRLRPRSRILFHGPPGNGKTSLACALASIVGIPAYGVTLSSVVTSYMGATGEKLGKLFGALSAGCMLVVDEIDAIGTERGGKDNSGANREMNGIVNTLLTLLDRVQEGVLVATTNRVELLDPALLRRFDACIEFPAPTPELAERLAVKLCEEFGVDRDNVKLSGCANFDAIAKDVTRIARRELLARAEFQAAVRGES